MTIEELDKFLNEYNEDELMYRDYYHYKIDPCSSENFLKNLDLDLIKERRLIIQEAHTGYSPDFIKEEDYFFRNRTNIILSKHNRYTPAFTHSHTFLEMIYVYSGKCRQLINGSEIEIKKGDICIIPPEANHSIHVFDDSIIVNVLIKRSTFNDTFLKVLSDENILSSFFSKILFTQHFNNYIIFHTYDNEKIRETLSNLMIEAIENKKYSNKALDNLLMLFFAYLLRDHENDVELPQELENNAKYLTSVLSYIQDHYKNVTLKELSNQFHFSVPYLSKTIKATTGYNFKEITLKIKLNEATELLSQSSLKICNISQLVGFDNNTNFIRSFKKTYGISPNQYRKKTKELPTG